MAIFTIDNHALYYTMQGSPEHPSMVWLHHGLGASADWSNLTVHFSDSYCLLAVDRWGYGKSDPREVFHPGFMETDAGELCALLDHLKIRDAFLVGHSDGGTIALLAAAHRPDLVRALVVIAPHIYYEPKMAEGINRLKGKIATDERAQAALESSHGGKWQELCESWASYWLANLEIGSFLIPPDVLKTISQPVLVIQGIEDEYATPQHAHDIAELLPNSELWLIPNAGHSPHHKLPEVFADRVHQFFVPERQDRK